MPALWFLGLTDNRWCAAELSRQEVDWATELKSSESSAAEGLGGLERGRVCAGGRATNFKDAVLGVNDTGWENGWGVACKEWKNGCDCKYGTGVNLQKKKV